MQNTPKVSFSGARKSVIMVFAAAFIFALGYTLGLYKFEVKSNEFPEVKITHETPPERGTLEFDFFWRVWDTLDTKYYDNSKLIEAKMVYGAIQGMVAAVGDPYTVFLPPEDNKVVQEDLKGNFGGVGIQIEFKGTQLAVAAPLPGTPAEKAGVLAGDYITGIKDEAKGIDTGTAGMSLPDAIQAIRGPKGSTVTLALLRDGVEEVIIVDLVRDEINVPSVTLEYVGENNEIAHLKLLKFAGETQGEWDTAVLDILKRPDVKGIIVDVRNNPGGYMQGAIDMASDFLEKDEPVVSEESGGNKVTYRVEKLGRLRDHELVILINGGSASASEIFAGAMRDNEKTPLVGETSFGKGTIQEPLQLDKGSGLHVTIARWLTPDNVWVNDGGLKPDVEVEDDPATTEIDEQLVKAIETLSKN